MRLDGEGVDLVACDACAVASARIKPALFSMPVRMIAWHSSLRADRSVNSASVSDGKDGEGWQAGGAMAEDVGCLLRPCKRPSRACIPKPVAPAADPEEYQSILVRRTATRRHRQSLPSRLSV